MPEDKSKNEIDRLRSIVSPIREHLERGSRIKKALARFRSKKKQNQPPDEKHGAA